MSKVKTIVLQFSVLDLAFEKAGTSSNSLQQPLFWREIRAMVGLPVRRAKSDLPKNLVLQILKLIYNVSRNWNRLNKLILL